MAGEASRPEGPGAGGLRRQHDSKWSFDAAEGRDEILLRRIGRNELDAIKVCRGYGLVVMLDGAMIDGFALVAAPAEYRTPG
jgi:hypothetical protein